MLVRMTRTEGRRCTKGAVVRFLVTPSDSEKEQYTIRKRFSMWAMCKVVSKISVTPKLRLAHVEAGTVGITCGYEFSSIQ